MSTKIHNGLRLVEGVDIFDATAKLREVMNPIRDLLDARILVNRAVELLDDAALEGKPLVEHPLWASFEKYEADQKKRKPTEHGYDPNRFGISFGRDEVTGRILALSYFDQPEYRDALEATGLFEDYAYWNNTDQPDHVTDEEWADRRGTWDRVVGYLPPIRSMVSFDLRSDDAGDVLMLAIDHDRPEVISRALEDITPRRRAERIARNRCLNALMEGVEPQMHLFMAAYRKAVKIADPVTDVVEPLLPTITVDVLYEPNPAIEAVDTAPVDAAVRAAVGALSSRSSSGGESTSTPPSPTPITNPSPTPVDNAIQSAIISDT